MVRLILLPGYLRIPYHRNYRFRQRYKPRTRSGPLNWFCQNYCRSDTVRVSTMQPRSNLAWQGVFKNGSRRRAEADFRARNTSASSPRRLRLLRRFLNSLWGSRLRHRCRLMLLSALLLGAGRAPAGEAVRTEPPAPRKTAVSIVGDEFHINGRPTYPGRVWGGRKIQGLLLNSRMVQGIFDDRNPETVKNWAYPDTGEWDAERNTREFVAAMPEWRRHGLLAFTINLQGGSPEGYSKGQPWHNSAITKTGELRSDYMARLQRILDLADDLGMVVLLGVFNFWQDERIDDEAAVKHGLDAAVDWVLDHGYRNVLLEVSNECDGRYHHDILKPDRIHELIERVKARQRDGRHLLVSMS